MRQRPASELLAALALVVAAAPAAAVGVRSWSPATAEAMRAGTVEGTSIDAAGTIRLAPPIDTVWGPDTGVVWAVADASGGAAWVALSDPARVVRVGPDGATEWYRGDADTWVTAVVADPHGGVYFGLSPSGRVMHATAPGEPAVVAETGAQYVWSLALERPGTLWIATGTPGRVLRLDGKGVPDALYEAGDDPVRSLAIAADGGVWAGTGREGRILRIPRQGPPFVRFDAGEDEIAALAVAADGAAYALGVRESGGAARPAERQEAPGSTSVTVTASAPPSDGGEATRATAAVPPKVPASRAGGRGGTVYRLDADGGVREIYGSKDEVLMTLAIGPSGRPWLGTGRDGRILEIDDRGGVAVVGRVPSDQVAAFARRSEGGLWVGASSDARLVRIASGAVGSGSWTSSAIDAGWIADWGRLDWSGDAPPGTKVALAVRSGNTDAPDETWSSWVRPATPPSGGGVAAAVPPARFAQVRVELTGAAKGGSPAVRRLELAYLTRNRPPRVVRLTVEDPGVAWGRGPSPSSSRNGMLVADDPFARRENDDLTGAGRAAGPIRKSYEAGVRTFVWDAQDPDGDDLRYDLAIARDGEDAWFPLASDLDDTFFSWDARGIPDGRYRVRLDARDAPDNSIGRELSALATSEPFVIDSTPPRLVVEADGRRVHVVVTDPGGGVESLEYAAEGGAWVGLAPVDGLADSPSETYDLEVPRNLGRRLVVRATDVGGNVAAAWVDLR